MQEALHRIKSLVGPYGPDARRTKHGCVQLLERRLNDCLVATDETQHGVTFVPLGALRRVLTPRAVGLALGEELGYGRKRPPGLEMEKEIKGLVEAVCGHDHAEGDAEPEHIRRRKSFRKIFGILLMIGKIELFPVFVDLGLDDEALPVPSFHDSMAATDDTATGARWMWAKESLEGEPLRLITDVQHKFLAPYFFLHSYYELDEETILPFTACRTLPGESHWLGSVAQVEIHPDHYDFQEYNECKFFALKTVTDFAVFDAEVKFAKRFALGRGRHIVESLVWYQQRCTYNVILPWAQGDLETFWEAGAEHAATPESALWVAEQSLGLAEALLMIHGGGQDDSKKVRGRHGDIKPANILWFSAEAPEDHGIGRLALGDFGLARMHRTVSRTNSQLSAVARSPSYHAPECDVPETGGRVSRSSDIWSLGATILELATWQMLGPEAVLETFPEMREAYDEVLGVHSDTYFTVTTHATADGGAPTRTPEVKPAVLEWIASLQEQEDCTPYLHDLLQLIGDRMLRAEPGERASAEELVARLRKLQQACLNDESYYSASRHEAGHSNSFPGKVDGSSFEYDGDDATTTGPPG